MESARESAKVVVCLFEESWRSLAGGACADRTSRSNDGPVCLSSCVRAHIKVDVHAEGGTVLENNSRARCPGLGSQSGSIQAQARAPSLRIEFS